MSSSTDASSSPINIRFRLAPGLGDVGTDITLRVTDPEKETLAELKAQLASRVNVPLDEIRLVYAGRVLKDDEESVSSLGLKDGITVHATKLARNRAAEEASTAAAAGHNVPGAGGAARNAFGLPDMSALLENPFVRSMLENPEFMRTMLENDPRIARLAESNPSLRQTLNDPRFLREMLDTMRNPALSQEMMRNVDRQLLNIENIPGGFNALSSIYHDIQAPLSQMREEDTSTDEANRRFAELLGAQQRSSSEGINNQALPNPWAPPPTTSPTSNSASLPSSPFTAPFGNPALFNSLNFLQPPSTAAPNTPSSTTAPSLAAPHFDFGSMMQQIQQLQGAFQPFEPLTASTAAPAQPQVEPQSLTESHEERFAEQLNTLRDMGFEEKDRCIRALLAAGGNVEAAIAYMLDSP
ncbi:uncharacterized protein SPPG_01231 [Spizellomyces punctatus DAOM BR117]|uniref:Ubiquilin n=1 Tax=Spizellomyces punctatus (strain DAOM BR117) TaxID=645134 RepID=A0A0L0HSE5_SPIPD|nr:uncharacterized protein SPPG_01231 [Spizellomyces punctatus DAOM BR117]KND03774.1 hypothetical protein SPPG_01231 [Spizellomyces punctatus DAOM BR117]|eukprot:XP_016611813.1 hypothetical protein SPPG_01231 [Spizellomyces punctatus DAOM BR117]